MSQIDNNNNNSSSYSYDTITTVAQAQELAEKLTNGGVVYVHSCANSGYTTFDSYNLVVSFIIQDGMLYLFPDNNQNNPIMGFPLTEQASGSES